jgi:hypothetical protein
LGGWEVREMGSEWKLNAESNISSKLKVEDPPFFGGLKAERIILATDAHRRTRTDRFKAGSWEAGKRGRWEANGSSKLKAEQGIGLRARGAQGQKKETPSPCPLVPCMAGGSESSVRDKT